MRACKGLCRWRPGLGVVAIGMLAFSVAVQGAPPSLRDGDSGARVAKAGAKHAPRLVTVTSVRPDALVPVESGSRTYLSNRGGAAAFQGDGLAYLYRNTGGQGYIGLQEAGGIEEQGDQVILTVNNPVVEYSVDVSTSSCGGVPWGGTADVYVSLRENDDQGTPGDISDDAPDCAIPGTEAIFVIDLSVITTYTLAVDLGAGITVGDADDAVWVAVRIDSLPRPAGCNGEGLAMPGWRIAEVPEVGFTDDYIVGFLGPWGLGNCFSEFAMPTPCQTPPDPDICFWGYGPPIEWAGMNAVLLGDAAAEFDVRPVAATGTHTIDGHEIIMPAGGQTVQVEVFVGMWDDGSDTTQVSAYQATLHCPDYYTGVYGTLTPLDTPTIMWGPEDPYPSFGIGVDKTRDDYIFKYAGGDFGGCHLTFLCPDMVTPLAFYCGFATANPQPCIDVGNGVNCIDEYRYVTTFSFDVSSDAKGTFTVGLSPNPVLTSLKNQFSQNISPLGVVPTLITVELGRCCRVDPGVYLYGCTDGVLASECNTLGGQFAGGEECSGVDELPLGDPDGLDDACICLGDEDCDDGNACTDDTCDLGTGECSSVPNYNVATECCNPATGVAILIDDGDQCTIDACNESNGQVSHDCDDGGDCDDGNGCTAEDVCVDYGTSCPCEGTDINTYPCDTVADCPTGAQNCEGDPNPGDGVMEGFCVCTLETTMYIDIGGYGDDDTCCFEEGELITADVMMGAGSEVVTGAQFLIVFDPECVEYTGFALGTVFTQLLYSDIGPGSVFLAVGVPMGDIGTQGPEVLASLGFVKLGGCDECEICYDSANPENTILTNDEGHRVPILTECSCDIHLEGEITLNLPENALLYPDCGLPTGSLYWDEPTATDECDDPLDLVCEGEHDGGVNIDDLIMGGGEFPQGLSTFCCTATNTVCGNQESDCWTVNVTDQHTLDVTVQLSPIMTPGTLVRCIIFEFFLDCVQAPVFFEEDLVFGPPFDFPGHATPTYHVPKGQFACMSARDPLHTLRGCADVECLETGELVAVFKGDPVLGGNWLIGGNLDFFRPDGNGDVIDILDFGMWYSQYLMILDPNTPCGTEGPHADINGDGIVDALDFVFISMNYIADSKICCCDDPGRAQAPITSITVKELRAMGLGDLAVADLNGDGVLDGSDMAAFMDGNAPTKPSVKRGVRSSLGN